MAYDTTVKDNVGMTPFDLIYITNEWTNGAVVLGLMTVLMIIGFFWTYKETNSPSNGLIISGLTGFIITLMFWAAQAFLPGPLITWDYLAIPIAVLLAGIIVKAFD